MTTPSPAGRWLIAVLALLVLPSCSNVPLVDTLYMPLRFFPCAGFDPSAGAWYSHPLPPLPGAPPATDGGTALDAGTSPDAGGGLCFDAGSAYVPDASVTSCDWMVLDRKTTVIMEHGLGRAPSLVLVSISFYPDGRGSSLAVGNTLLVVQSCAKTVTLRNDTNQRFYARVWLQ